MPLRLLQFVYRDPSIGGQKWHIFSGHVEDRVLSDEDLDVTGAILETSISVSGHKVVCRCAYWSAVLLWPKMNFALDENDRLDRQVGEHG